MTAVNLRYGIFLGPHHPVDEDPTYLIHRDFELMEWIDKLGFAEAWIETVTLLFQASTRLRRTSPSIQYRSLCDKSP